MVARPSPARPCPATPATLTSGFMPRYKPVLWHGCCDARGRCTDLDQDITEDGQTAQK